MRSRTPSDEALASISDSCRHIRTLRAAWFGDGYGNLRRRRVIQESHERVRIFSGMALRCASRGRSRHVELATMSRIDPLTTFMLDAKEGRLAQTTETPAASGAAACGI